jgi:hypothetical protein
MKSALSRVFSLLCKSGLVSGFFTYNPKIIRSACFVVIAPAAFSLTRFDRELVFAARGPGMSMVWLGARHFGGGDACLMHVVDAVSAAVKSSSIE